MKDIIADEKLVAFCGLYCAVHAGRFEKESAPVAGGNEKASWCKIRTCCQENSFQSCAGCVIVDDLHDCGTFNTLISKFSRLFSFKPGRLY